MAGYDEIDFPVGDFARIVKESRERVKRRTRDLEKLDAASKQRVVPRISSLESRAAAHEQRTIDLYEQLRLLTLRVENLERK